MIKDLLEEFLGEANQKHETQLKFNCPNCAQLDNNGEPDGKHNLEVNLANDNPKYGSDKIFHCWKCEYKGGNIKNLIYKYGGKELYKYYIDNSLESLIFEGKPKKKIKNLWLPKGFLPINKFDLKNEKHKEAYNYLVKKRNIPLKTLEYYGIGACFYGYYNNRIIIPSYDKNDELNFFTARSFTDESPSYLTPSVDKDNIIINEKNINWNLPIFLVEGYFDLFALPVNTIPLNGKEILHALNKKIHQYNPPLVVILDPDATEKMQQILDEYMFLELPFLKKIEIKSNDLAKNFEDKGKSYIFDITKKLFV